MPAIVYTLKY